MEVLFGTENSILYLLVFILVSLGITLLIYFKNKELREIPKWQVRILFILRFLSVFFLSILLLSPIIKSLKRYINNPIIITAFDNTASLKNAGEFESLEGTINHIQTSLKNELGSGYNLVNYTFGENSETGGELTFGEKKSDYSNLINTVYNNHFNQNVGAMIVVGDGIYNIGANPVSEVQKLDFPLYSVGVGDTNVVKDAAVRNVKVNRNAFVGNRFPVEIDMQFDKMPNQPVVLEISNGSEIVYSERIVPASEDFFTSTSINLEASTPGLHRFYVRLNSPIQERNTTNNKSEFVIHVLENKQKILILSEGPHPDLGAIKNTLELQPNYEVSLFTKEPYPENLNDYNLIILNQIPSASSTARNLVLKTMESKIPLLFIVGNNTFIPQFNQLNQGIEIITQARNQEEAQPVLNTDFELFSTDEELSEIVERFPPLMVPFAEINLNPSLQTLLFQNLNNIKTFRPLIALGNLEGRKTGVIFGEGIWRWRLYNYYFNESHEQFSELITSIVQYLSLRENEDNFIIKSQSVYYDTDPVILQGEVYNEAYELITEPEVNIELSDEKGNNFQYIFDVNGDYYKLDAGKLPSGNYHFDAKVRIGNEEFAESGDFTVVPLQIENTNSRANFNVLFQMSNLTGGEFYNANEVEQLVETIKSSSNIKPVNYFQASVKELLNLKWLFVVLLVVFGVEWFLRKYWGIY